MIQKIVRKTLWGLFFFAFFEKFVAPILTSGGLAAVSSSAFAALYSAFGKYDVVHIHAEGPAFFAWLPKMFGKRVVVTECRKMKRWSGSNGFAPRKIKFSSL